MEHIETKKSELSKKLLELAKHWNQANRMDWGYRNDVSLATINRYMSGNVASIPLAEAILSEAKKYAK